MAYHGDMLSIVCGSAARLWRGVASELEERYHGGARCVLLVPEQYTLQVERDIIADLRLPGFFDIDVLSPSRLTSRVLERMGAEGRVRIDARGKSVALSRALHLCAPELQYYARAVGRQGFVARAGELIANFKRAGVSPDMLRAHAEALEDSAERDKLGDLARIYDVYSQMLAGRFVDGEDVLSDVIVKLQGSGVLAGAHVIVYGFDMLTEQFSRLLCAADAQAPSVSIYLALMGENAPGGDWFEPVRGSAERLRALLLAAGRVCEMRYLPDAPEERAPELAHLSRELLARAPRVCALPPENLRLFAAPTPYAEAQFILQCIALERERGVPLSDMQVLCGDLAQLSGALESAFASYGIPAYIARKLPAVSHGAARFLLASLRAAAGGYRPEDMLDVIQSGFAPLAEDACWRLENYMLGYGIVGNKWKVPFTRGEDDERDAAESARALLIPPMLTLQAALASARDADASISAVTDYLDATGVYERLLSQEEELLARGLPERASQARQMWEALISLLSQTHELMGGSRVPGKHIASWLEAGLLDCELSALPDDGERVICGEIASVPSARPRVVFLAGLYDTGADADPGLLSIAERENAERALGAYLGLGADGHAQMAQLDVWKALSEPRERLYLTYSQATQGGQSLRPARVIDQIRRMFPALVTEGGATAAQEAVFALAPRPALRALAPMLAAGDMPPEWLGAWRWLSRDPVWGARAKALADALTDRRAEPPLPEVITRKLFLDDFLSITRLEGYAACPQKHFIEYGLKPKKRREWRVEASDTGKFYHAAMEGFTRLLPQYPDWPNIPKTACDALMDSALAPLVQAFSEQPMGDSARMRAMGARYANACKRVAWTFTRVAASSAFYPARAEVRFGYEDGMPPISLTLPDGSRALLRGVIDRIDRYAGDDGVYLRVVDYKSGAEKLSPTRVWWGLQLQLLLYLQAAVQGERGASPAGAYYQHVFEPLLADDERMPDVEDALAKELRLQGVSLADAEILRLMDAGEPPLSMPLLLNGDGSVRKGALACSLDELSALIRHAHRQAVKLTAAMRSGDIAPAPAREGTTFDACAYCEYAGVCRRDALLASDARALEKLTFEELVSRAVGEDDGEGTGKSAI